MTPVENEHPATLADIEPAIERFEDAWQQGRRPDLTEYLPAEPALRRNVLVELVHIDLELRLKAGEAVRVETYLQRFSELAGDRGVVLSLIALEFALRARSEAALAIDEYHGRFPQLRGELSARLRSRQRTSLSQAPLSNLTLPVAANVPAAMCFPALPGYEIIEELGRGGMGVVYRARQVQLKRFVALKMILAGRAASPAVRARFRSEAEAAARLQHPNIVQIHAIGEHEDRPYFAMELVEGGSLERKLGHTPQPAHTAAELVETLARAVDTAHQSGIVHRDLKPANVLLQPIESGESKADSQGTADTQISWALDRPLSALRPRITDFGLAKHLDGAAGATVTGEVLGTPSYMAPEQAEGRIRAIGPATDIYALGAILYEMLTGRPPFRGNTPMDTIRMVLSQEPVAPSRLQSQVPRDLEIICLKCLQKEPGKRYTRAADLADDLHRFRAGETIQARPASRSERTWRWCRRNPASALAVGLGALLLATLVVSSFILAWTESRNASRLADANADILKEQGRLTEANATIVKEQGRTKSALQTAEKNEQEAIRQRQRAERQSVELLLDKGLGLCEQGEVGRGLIWLARGIEVAERSEASADLQNTLRANLAAWSRQIRPLRHVFTHDAGQMAIIGGKVAGAEKRRLNPRPIDVAYSSLAFSPDSRLLVTCGAKTAQMHEVTTGRPVGPPLNHGDLINAAAFSPDGKTLLTGSNDRMARRWDVATGKLLGPPLPHGDTVRLAVYAPDGRTFMTVSGPIVYRWDAATARPLDPPLDQGALVQAAAFSPDGTMILTGCQNNMARLWETATGRPLTDPLPHGPELQLVAFNPKGKTFVTAFRDAQLWDISSGKPIGKRLDHPLVIWALAYSPDGRTLLTTDLGGNARLWEAATGKPLNVQLQKQGNLLTCGFTQDGSQFFLAGGAGAVQFRDTATGQPLGPPIRHEVLVAYTMLSPDGRTILTYDINGVVRLWDAHPSPPRATPMGNPAGLPILAYSPDSKTLVVAGTDNAAHVLTAATGRTVIAPLQHPATVLAAAFGPDGKILLTGCADRKARLWDLTTGQPLGPALEHAQNVQTVAWAPGGGRFLTVTNAGMARLWDSQTGKPVTKPFSWATPDPFGCTPLDRLAVAQPSAIAVRGSQLLLARMDLNTVHVSDTAAGEPKGIRIDTLVNVDAVAFSPDGRALATGGSDTMIRLWDPLTGKPLLPPLPNTVTVFGAAFSPDGRRLLSRGSDLSYRLWDPATGGSIGPVWNDVATATFSPDGKVLLVAGQDQSFRAWDALTGRPIGPALRHPDVLRELALSTDGRLLRTINEAGNARLWNLELLPLTGNAERLTLWVQLITGLVLDDAGVLHGLEPTAWQRNQQRLEQLGGRPLPPREN